MKRYVLLGLLTTAIIGCFLYCMDDENYNFNDVLGGQQLDETSDKAVLEIYNTAKKGGLAFFQKYGTSVDNLSRRNSKELTALDLAYIDGDRNAITVLKSNGITFGDWMVVGEDKDEDDPALLKEFLQAAKVGLTALYMKMRLKKIPLENIKSNNGNRLLHEALQSYNLSAVDTVLFICGSKSKMLEKNNNDKTPMQLARDIGQSFVDLFIKYGLLLNDQNIRGNTVLHDAVNGGYIEIFEQILKAGLRAFMLSGLFHVDEKEIKVAIEKNSYEMYSLVMKEKQESAMQDFFEKNFAYILEVNLGNKEGNTALHLAAKQGNQTILRRLLQVGRYYDMEVKREKRLGSFVPIVNIDQQNNDGDTALHFAVRSGNIDLVEILLQYDVDINLSNKEKLSPVDIAKKRQLTHITKRFEEYVIKKQQRMDEFLEQDVESLFE